MKRNTEKVTIDNITFNLTIDPYGEEAAPIEDLLGYGRMEIPPSMFRVFAKETGSIHSDYISIPHEEIGRGKAFDPMISGHSCTNADTHIVLMSHFFEKRRKYEIDFLATDPFWLFHDSRHAVKDVYNEEVNFICSRIEHERLIEGQKLAVSKGFSMTALTLHLLNKQWKDRWRRETGHADFDLEYFFNHLSEEEKFKYECYSSSEKIVNILSDLDARILMSDRV